MSQATGPGPLSNRPNRIRLSALPGIWFLPWILPVATSLYLKHCVLVHSGYRVTAESLGRTNGFGLWDRLSFFRMDVIVAALATVPLFFLCRLLPRRLRLLFVSGLSLGMTLALYAQLRAFLTVGQFLSFRMFWAGITWALHEPAAYASYLGTNKMLVVLSLSVIILGSLLLLKRPLLVPVSIFHGSRRGSATLDVILCCLVPVIAVHSLPTIPPSPYLSSVFVRALSAYWLQDQLPTGQFANLDGPALLSEYHEINHAPPPKENELYFGKAKGSNVIFFVLETTPAAFLPPGENMDDLPNLRALRQRSFVALSHHTTFPRTHEAVFSLLSSWYPLDPNGAFEGYAGGRTGLKVPGVMAALSARGYDTAIYSPMRGGASPDEQMFRELAVQRQVYPPDSFVPPPGDARDEWQQARIARDLDTLDLMKKDLDRSLSSGRPFAAVFLPQIGHFPYPEVSQDGHEPDVRKRARRVLEVQDRWLGQLMELVQRRQPNNTIIVVVGDHGVRSREEDPNFVPGMIDEYSFHVPLLVYAPMALKHPVMIPWLTSHIDVTPTVLDLLGIRQGREFEQGSPIWDARLVGRTTYFFANWMFGADGYYSRGRFYMRSLMSGAVYASPHLHFHTRDIVPMDSAGYKQLALPPVRMAALQEVTAALFTSADPLRSRIFVEATLAGPGAASLKR